MYKKDVFIDSDKYFSVTSIDLEDTFVKKWGRIRIRIRIMF